MHCEARQRTKAEPLDLVRRETSVMIPVYVCTRRTLMSVGLWNALASAVDLAESLSYIEIPAAIRVPSVIIKDSGRLQKQALFLCTPCVSLRGDAEWTETVALG